MDITAETGTYERQEGNKKHNERNAGRKISTVDNLIKQLTFYSLRSSRWKKEEIIKVLSISPRTYSTYNSMYNGNREYFSELGISTFDAGRKEDYQNWYRLELNAAKEITDADNKNSFLTQIEKKVLADKKRKLERAAVFKDADEYRTFDTGIYTDIVNGYLTKALNDIMENKELKGIMQDIAPGIIMAKVTRLMEEVPAKAAETYYNRKKHIQNNQFT